MAVDAVELAGPHGARQRLVLKRWLRPGWDVEDPSFTPAYEAAILDGLAGGGVPAPRVVAVDPDGRLAGAPSLLMTHLDGRRPSLAEEVRPARIAAMAEVLVRIHAAGDRLRRIARPFAPYYGHARLRLPPGTARPGLWRAGIDLAGRAPDTPAGCLVHRDYHPANTVWQGGRLTGVVDWTSASWGPGAVDLAHWRANLGARHGIAVADRVLAAWAAVDTVPGDQAWWDVRMLLDFIDDPAALQGEGLLRTEAYLAALLGRI
jgi:aminoglycoside phosphotransferase (APT) family kinase protein